MNELITLVMVIIGWIVGLFAIPASAAVISAIVWHCFPDFAYSKWMDREFFQSEDTSCNHEDWLSERMRK